MSAQFYFENTIDTSVKIEKKNPIACKLVMSIALKFCVDRV